MNINKLIKEAHENAVDKGFWAGKHGDIIRALAFINSELYKALDAHRNNKFACKTWLDKLLQELNDGWWNQATSNEVFESEIKDTFEDEIADVLIRIFDLMGYLKYEYLSHIHIPCILSKNLSKDILFINNITNRLFVYFDSGFSEEIKIDCFNYLIDTVFDFCKTYNIDIEKHISLKMTYNKTRLRKL